MFISLIPSEYRINLSPAGDKAIIVNKTKITTNIVTSYTLKPTKNKNVRQFNIAQIIKLMLLIIKTPF